jgi:hypothetical protein
MSARPPGPVETHPWPTELDAYVVTPGDDPRLYGYSVEADIARFGGFGESILLSLTGELPSEEQRRAFDVALTFLAPLSVAEAPTHAAVLARICGARSSSVVGIAAVALAERARYVLEPYAAVLAWLDAPSEPFPAARRATTDSERSSVARLRALLPGAFRDAEVFRHDPDRMTAVLAALHAAGLRRLEQLEPVFVIASLAPAVAESFHREVASFRKYPMQLPLFEYVEPERG